MFSKSYLRSQGIRLDPELLKQHITLPKKIKERRKPITLETIKLLIEKAKVAVSPGIGFGEGGDNFVRFALVENEHRIRQAVRGIRDLM